jgi:hypothetical protein
MAHKFKKKTTKPTTRQQTKTKLKKNTSSSNSCTDSTNSSNSANNSEISSNNSTTTNTVMEQLKTLSLTDNTQGVTNPIASSPINKNNMNAGTLPKNTSGISEIHEASHMQPTEHSNQNLGNHHPHPFEAIVESIVKSQQTAIENLNNENIEQRKMLTHLQNNVIKDQHI